MKKEVGRYEMSGGLGSLHLGQVRGLMCGLLLRCGFIYYNDLEE